MKQHALPPWVMAVLEAEKKTHAASPELAVFVLPEVIAILTADDLPDVPETHARPLRDGLERALAEVPNASDLVLRAFFEMRVAQAAFEGVPAPKAAEITLLAAASGLEPLGTDSLDVARKRWESRLSRWRRDAPPPIIGIIRAQFGPPIDALFVAGVAEAIGAAIRASQLATTRELGNDRSRTLEELAAAFWTDEGLLASIHNAFAAGIAGPTLA